MDIRRKLCIVKYRKKFLRSQEWKTWTIFAGNVVNLSLQVTTNIRLDIDIIITRYQRTMKVESSGQR